MVSSSVGLGSGGSGGGGFSLGPAQNTFGTTTTANRAAAEALRQAYEDANTAWLALYNGDRSFYIQLIWTGNASVVQRRNAAGDDWEDVTGIIRGPPGTDGSPRTGPEVVTLLQALIGDARLNATALRLIADALDTELGNTDWRTGGTGGGGTADGTVDALTLALVAGVLTATAGLTVGNDVTSEGLDLGEIFAQLAAANAFTAGITVGSPSGGPLTVEGENAGNSTIMKIFTPGSGTQKAFGAGREGEFDWVQFAGEVVAGKPGFALGPGTARDTNLYREEEDHLKTDDAFTAAGDITTEGDLAAAGGAFSAVVSGVTPTADEHLATKEYVDSVAGGGGTPVDHTRYGALGADATFVAGDFTGGSGFNSDTSTLAVPAFATDQFLAFAIRDDIADPTDIREEGSAFNSFSLFTKQAAQIAISTDMYNVWISNAALLSNNAAQNWVIS